jgi:hypothetical protein
MVSETAFSDWSGPGRRGVKRGCELSGGCSPSGNGGSAGPVGLVIRRLQHQRCGQRATLPGTAPPLAAQMRVTSTLHDCNVPSGTPFCVSNFSCTVAITYTGNTPNRLRKVEALNRPDLSIVRL